MSLDPSRLPYRPCVGIALFNARGKVWLGRRADAPGEAEGAGTWWQMPQGGIDAGEDPLTAAMRELYEETSVTSVELIKAASETVRYDLPVDLISQSWGGKYRGQEQYWFALRFTGSEDEINVLSPGGGKHKSEFSEWRWDDLAATPDLVVDFKRPVYATVVRLFAYIR